MPKPLAECRVTVVGLGLMGASLCMDLVQGGLCREVRGVTRRADAALHAFFEGAVDQATTDLQAGVSGADIVVLATPVRTIVDMTAEVGPHLWPGTVLMDMGSTKAAIVDTFAQLPPGIQPVGSHPMTGKEQAGYAAAEAGLYRDAPWILSPPRRTGADGIALARSLVEAVGARPYLLDPDRHDRLVAAMSHLPFLLASALVGVVSDVGESDPLVWELAAGGFRDTSRVAASDTRMFLDILMTNREAVLEQMRALGSHLATLEKALERSDEAALETILRRTQSMRSGWQQKPGGD